MVSLHGKTRKKALCDGDAQLHQEEAFSRFGGACNQHLVPLTEDSPNQFRGKAREFILVFAQRDCLRKITVEVVRVILPVFPRAQADVDCHEGLALAFARHAWQTCHPGGIGIRTIDGNAVLCKEIVHILDATIVFGTILGAFLLD